MGIPSQQIGWSQKAKLLWNLSKQLEKLTQVAGNVQVTPGPVTTSTTTTIQPTTTTTTTSVPQPVSAYTGVIELPTTGNTFFQFQISTKSTASNLTVAINWGDNTAENYVVLPDSIAAFSHTFTNVAPNNIITVTVNDPSYIYQVIIGPNFNPGSVQATRVDFDQYNGMLGLLLDNNLLHTLSVNNIYSLESLQAANSDLESVSITDVPVLGNIYLNNNNLSVLDLTSATNVTYVNLSNNQLVAIDISDSPNITYLNVKDNSLSQTGVDNILVALVAANKTNGYVELSGGTNAAPSSVGQSAISTLGARGWTVITNTSSSAQTKLMYYMFGYSYGISNTMFINEYYANNNVNKYVPWYVSLQPKTVYYVGTFGPGTTLFTNPELTQFVVPQAQNWGYWTGVFVDATLNEQNVPGDISIYSFSSTTGVIYQNLGTVATSTFTHRPVFRSNNTSTYCDATNQWYQIEGYYPPGQNGAVVGGYIHSDIYQFTGTPGNNTIAPVFRTSLNASTKFLLDNSNTGLIVGSESCTYIPVWNATWGATAQEAISGVNPISIKPYNGNSMLTTTTIIPASGNFSSLPAPFYIAYDGIVRAFNNGYTEAYWNQETPLELVTPPVTPYSFQLLPTSQCSQYFNPDNDPYKFTVYSNFPLSSIGAGTPMYLDAALTTPLDSFSYYTNGQGYFIIYPWESGSYPRNFYSC